MQTSRQTVPKITSEVKKEIIKIVDERMIEVHVTKEDFSELKGIVRELAEAQKRTEIKVAELAEKVTVLAEGVEITRQELN